MMNININRIECCTIGEYHYNFTDRFDEWKSENRDKEIVHLMQSQDDKYIVVTIWYRKAEG